MKKILLKAFLSGLVFISTIFLFGIIYLKVRAVVSNASPGSQLSASNRNELLTQVFQKNGSNLYYNTGNIGIGTNNPAQPLQIGYSELETSSSTHSMIVNSNSTKSTGIIFGKDNNNRGWLGWIPGSDTIQLGVKKDGVGYLNVIDGNKFGIQTTSPQATLHINGNLRIDGIMKSTTNSVTYSSDNIWNACTNEFGSNRVPCSPFQGIALANLSNIAGTQYYRIRPGGNKNQVSNQVFSYMANVSAGLDQCSSGYHSAIFHGYADHTDGIECRTDSTSLKVLCCLQN